ncbi:hypothetical protein [Cohnella boryungensis]|uniref:DUF3939 domain-containing protein n=1 Tax=Cohnella boryungensis TaxID=768479 RepID=A0ABV8S5E3_9BACL
MELTASEGIREDLTMHGWKWRKALAWSMTGLLLVTLTGCLYPEDQSPGNNISAREAITAVQTAVDRYRDDSGLLPIQNASEETPLYEKYKVDFGKLKRMGYLSQIPAAAFESGGGYQFLIIDEESDKPQVKLLDLAVFQAVGDVQRKVTAYRAANGKRNPAGDEVYPDFHAIDFARLGIASPEIRSMYSRQTLNWLVDGQGNVYADYGVDVATAVEKTNKEPAASEDLRRALIEASYYVPVRSPAYRWIDGEPRAARP